jgi:hypothetical protein
MPPRSKGEGQRFMLGARANIRRGGGRGSCFEAVHMEEGRKRYNNTVPTVK